jgi:hypothetical protein
LLVKHPLKKPPLADRSCKPSRLAHRGHEGQGHRLEYCRQRLICDRDRVVAYRQLHFRDTKPMLLSGECASEPAPNRVMVNSDLRARLKDRTHWGGWRLSSLGWGFWRSSVSSPPRKAPQKFPAASCVNGLMATVMGPKLIILYQQFNRRMSAS